MEINLHNYEAFFLDYKEGNLDAAQEQELLAFLEQYPQLKVELDSYEDPDSYREVLEPEIVFENKPSLKKIELSDEAIIAYVEGVADHKTKVEVEKRAAENSAFRREVKLYENTVLVPELVKFPNKAKLKRGGAIIYLQNNPAVLRVAAAMLLLAGLFFLVSKLNVSESKEGSQPILAEGTQKENTAPVKNDLKEAFRPTNEKSMASANEKTKEAVVKDQNSEVRPHVKNDPPKKNETPLLVTNTLSPVNSNTVLASNNATKGSDTLLAKNKDMNPVNTTTNTATYKSWYNYELDSDKEEEKPVAIASTAPVKKTFFQKVTNAARKVNEFGVKKVAGEEGTEKNSLTIGGLVVTETTSN